MVSVSTKQRHASGKIITEQNNNLALQASNISYNKRFSSIFDLYITI